MTYKEPSKEDRAEANRYWHIGVIGISYYNKISSHSDCVEALVKKGLTLDVARAFLAIHGAGRGIY